MTEPTIMTVRGPIPASQLGLTLMHEHVITKMLIEFRGDGMLNDIPMAVDELGLFKGLGGRTVVDVTTADFGREPEALRVVSEMAGVQIVMGCGVYRHPYLDKEWVDRTSTNEIAAVTVKEIEHGVGDTGIRPGIIGEIACDEWITAHEEHASRRARAHHKTGLSITTHGARWPIGLTQLDLLNEEKVDSRRVIIGHSDTVRSVKWTTRTEIMDYHEALARRGTYVQFDTIGSSVVRRSEAEMQFRVTWVKNLLDKGFGKQILLSHDVAFLSNMRANGGNGYTFLLTDFLPRLEAAGVAKEQIQMILVDNPRRALTDERV